jgi:putative proteasome-type protease
MTYCVAVMLDAGMVFASDSRTNAGVDQIATFSKMHMIKRDGERLIVVLSSGNLSITQSAINLLELQSKSGDANRTINNASSMFEIADLVGNALREVRRRDGPYLEQSNI